MGRCREATPRVGLSACSPFVANLVRGVIIQSERSAVQRFATDSLDDSVNLPVLSPGTAGALAGHPSAAPSTLETLSPLQHTGLLEAQQMGNVGMLATGLAHDLNNLLTVILGSAELARGHTTPETAPDNHLQTIETTVRRAGDLCRAMLACARIDERKPVALDANAVAQEVVTLLQTSHLAFHRVHLELAAALPPISARPAQFRQVLLNLLINAAEACGSRGGRIRVTTSLTELDERAARELRPQSQPAGRYLRIRVADDGCGMDESTRAQIFTPFFSRKGSGRGLGLASLVEILRIHQGGIRMFSELQRGTIMDVFFPSPPRVATSAPPPQRQRSTPAGATARLVGKVLIADDEETLRQSLATFLGSEGLTVHAVADGQAALAHLRAHPDTHVALLDRMMPKMGGLEVLQTLRAAGQRTPVILMSGNPEIDSERDDGALAPVTAIAKPFSLVELVTAIARHLPVGK